MRRNIDIDSMIIKRSFLLYKFYWFYLTNLFLCLIISCNTRRQRVLLFAMAHMLKCRVHLRSLALSLSLSRQFLVAVLLHGLASKKACFFYNPIVDLVIFKTVNSVHNVIRIEHLFQTPWVLEVIYLHYVETLVFSFIYSVWVEPVFMVLLTSCIWWDMISGERVGRRDQKRKVDIDFVYFLNPVMFYSLSNLLCILI